MLRLVGRAAHEDCSGSRQSKRFDRRRPFNISSLGAAPFAAEIRVAAGGEPASVRTYPVRDIRRHAHSSLIVDAPNSRTRHSAWFFSSSRELYLRPTRLRSRSDAKRKARGVRGAYLLEGCNSSAGGGGVCRPGPLARSACGLPGARAQAPASPIFCPILCDKLEALAPVSADFSV